MDQNIYNSSLENCIHDLENQNTNKECLNLIAKLEKLRKRNLQETTEQSVKELVEIVSELLENMGCTVWLTHYLTQTNLQNVGEERLGTIMNILQRTLIAGDLNSISNVLQVTSNISQCNAYVAGLHWCSLMRGVQQVLVQLVDNNEDDTEEFRVVVVQCLDIILGSILEAQIKIGKTEMSILEKIALTLLKTHYNSKRSIKTSSRALIFGLRTLKLLNKVVNVSAQFAEANVGLLIGLVRVYIHFGCLRSVNEIPLPQKAHASQQELTDILEDDTHNISSQSNGCGGKITKTRKPRVVLRHYRHPDLSKSHFDIAAFKNNFASYNKASDSDNSDLECTISQLSNDNYFRINLRLSSIILLGSVVRVVNHQTLYGYWHVFFPCETEKNSNCGLFYVTQHDYSARCRCAALQIIAQILLDSKKLIGMAESGRPNSAFQSYAVSLGNIVVGMYQALIHILEKEASLPVLTHALKCLAVLVQATSFQKLSTGLVTRFMREVKPLIYHRDSTIQVSALMVMEFLLARSELTTEIADAAGLLRPISLIGRNDNETDQVNLNPSEYPEEFIESDDDSKRENHNVSDGPDKNQNISKFCNDSSWLLLRVLNNLNCNNHTKNKNSTSVCIESLQLISTMLAHLTRLHVSCLDGITSVLHKVLEDPLAEIRLYAARCLDNCAYYISQHVLKKVDDIDICIRFWMTTIPVLTKQMSRECVQASGYKVCLCDSLSNIGSVIFERLPHKTQMNLICFLSGISNDCTEDVVTRAAAVRAMAVFILFPLLRGNLVFIENTAESILRLVSEGNMYVRVKTFWALGNISDALISIDTSKERISDVLLKRLIDAALLASSDFDKVRSNAVRALGNLLRLITMHLLDDISCRDSVKKAIFKLVDCLRVACNAKVKWNACFAIGSMLQNSTLFHVTEKYFGLEWKTTLYQNLCHVIIHHPNFKVRINAAAALTNIKDRVNYGSNFEMLWSATLTALEHSNSLDNFYEYNHRDQMQEQLCRTCCHLILCASDDDLKILKKHLVEKVEIVRNIWIRVINRMVPEMAAPLIACSVLLQERFNYNKQLSAEQCYAIHIIIGTLALP